MNASQIGRALLAEQRAQLQARIAGVKDKLEHMNDEFVNLNHAIHATEQSLGELETALKVLEAEEGYDDIFAEKISRAYVNSSKINMCGDQESRPKGTQPREKLD